MKVFKGTVFFLSGLMIIGAIACAVMFSLNPGVEVMGGAVMFLCFGVAGFLLAVNADSFVQLFRPGARRVQNG